MLLTYDVHYLRQYAHSERLPTTKWSMQFFGSTPLVVCSGQRSPVYVYYYLGVRYFLFKSLSITPGVEGAL